MITKYLKLIAVSILLINVCNATATIKNSNLSKDYLLKPTGQYNVGFENFHWINKNICPDPSFDGKNQKDFSPDNKNFCREMMVRIYYPTDMQSQENVPYYQPLIKKEQERLREIPSIPKEQIEQLNQIKIYSIEKAPIVSGKSFPVLLFSPGLGCPAELYENIIGELVSNGYIVIGMNSLFINLVALPNGHVVEPTRKTVQEIETETVPLIIKDLSNVFYEIRNLHHSNAIFNAMDLNHIGAFGHSIGARIVADASHNNPDWFQAAASLDIGRDDTGASLRKFIIPFMHEIGASRKIATQSPPLLFELGSNGYLVGLSPNEQNYNYSSHMNFSDFSTLQNLPVYQSLSEYLKKDAEEKFSLKLMSHEPTEGDLSNFPTFVLIKKEGEWKFYIYQNKKKTETIDIRMIKDLKEALVNLPNKPPEELRESDIKPVKKILLAFHHAFADFLGEGNGFEITYSINTYLVKFFNSYLKGIENPELKNCTILSPNTYIKCGPGQA